MMLTIAALLRRLISSEERIMSHMIEIQRQEESLGEQEASELLPHVGLQPEDLPVIDGDADDTDERLRGLESREQRDARRAHLRLAWTNRLGSRKAS